MGAGAALGGSVLLMLLLAALGGGGSSRPPPPSPGPEPGPLPDIEPPDESELADITDADLIPLVCEFWAGADPSLTDIALARLLLDGAIPQHDFEGELPSGSQRARLLDLAAEIIAAVRSGETSCELPISIDTVPRAGGYYQIKKGDAPLNIIKLAYPWASAGQRVELVRLVTNHPANGGGVAGQGIDIEPLYESTRNLIGPVIFSMLPRWRCSPRVAAQRFDSGDCFAVVYLPLITSL